MAPLAAPLAAPAFTMALALALTLTGTGCPPAETPPCFPASSATPVGEDEGGFSRKMLGWEIDKMPALIDAPKGDEAPSDAFLKAQRDMRTEFWPDAAKGFLAVVRGDTPDGKTIRLYAQYDLALSLFRMRYFEEAKRIFKLIVATPKHPRSGEAADWLQRKVCSG
jgi:hypothetical protein